jgi:hypothetical protein
METKSIVKATITVVCLVGSAGAIYNVQGDISALQQRAEQMACGPKACARLLGLQRQPTSQTFTFQMETGSAATKIIECSPAFLLFGEYDCKALN